MIPQSKLLDSGSLCCTSGPLLLLQIHLQRTDGLSRWHSEWDGPTSFLLGGPPQISGCTDEWKETSGQVMSQRLLVCEIFPSYLCGTGLPRVLAWSTPMSASFASQCSAARMQDACYCLPHCKSSEAPRGLRSWSTSFTSWTSTVPGPRGPQWMNVYVD